MGQFAHSHSNSRFPAILFVDDEPLAQKYFKSTFRQEAEVVTASSAKEAWTLLKGGQHQFSLVVSDERMPNESGVPFLTDVRKCCPSTVRILTSAYTDADKLQQAINEAAIYRFVPKPWDLEQLSVVVREALVLWGVFHKVNQVEVFSAKSEDVGPMIQDLLEPLRDLESEAAQLEALAGRNAIDPAFAQRNAAANWSSSLFLRKISAATARIQRQASSCLAAAEAIADRAHKPRTLQ